MAYDDEHVWLVRQPREAVREQALLELPAGKLDEAGETQLATAKRELAEEIGKARGAVGGDHVVLRRARVRRREVHLYLATGLRDAEGEHDAEENERIEIVPWPLERSRRS